MTTEKLNNFVIPNTSDIPSHLYEANYKSTLCWRAAYYSHLTVTVTCELSDAGCTLYMTADGMVPVSIPTALQR